MNQRDLCRISLAGLVSTTISIGFHTTAQAADKAAAKPDAAKSDEAKSDPATAAASTTAVDANLPATAAAQAKLAPEKREAIKRLMNVTRLPQVADKMYDMLYSQGQKSFELNLARSIQEDTRFSEDQKNTMMQQVVSYSMRMFARYRELLPKEINLPDVLESISTQVYDKYFTAKELNDISDFYQTPAGKKALDVLPQVMQESAQMTGEVVTPKVKEIVARILQEERTHMIESAQSATSTTSSSTAKPPEAKPETKQEKK